MSERKTALTIAGSDSSGGAGIQADIKTMMANGVYAMSAVTALTAQNTLGVTGIMNVTPEFLTQELDAVFTDIFPDAVKIGMVSEKDLIRAIVSALEKYQPRNVVVDPVMIATSGSRLITESAQQVLVQELLPMADLITPNIPEAEAIADLLQSLDIIKSDKLKPELNKSEYLQNNGISNYSDHSDSSVTHIASQNDMIAAAQYIGERCHTSVLLKGGHSVSDADDVLYLWNQSCTQGNENLQDSSQNGNTVIFPAARISNPNTHGTGCTLSSAIAANLAKGYSLKEAVSRAKEYITGAIGACLDLGHGHGPIDHAFNLKSKFS